MKTVTETKISSDNFLFIDNLQTTVRQLNVFSAIILLLNNKQLPKIILEKLLINWSKNEEIVNLKYCDAKGKITKEGLKTAALGYYLQISSLLGITTRFNDVYMNTKMSQTFLYFLSTKENSKDGGLDLSEKIFYLHKLLTTDADGIILCLNQLANNGEKKQRLLQREFKEAMNSRLLAKMESTTSILKSKLSAKYRTINYIWKNPESYAEHIIAPRYEWLSSLDLIKIKRTNKDTLYSLTQRGGLFYNLLPIIEVGELKDTNQIWLANNFFTIIDNIYCSGDNIYYSELSIELQEKELGGSLEKALKAVKSSLSFKLPLLETYFFVCMDFLLNKKIILNYSDIQLKLKDEFTFNSKGYFLKLSGRLNEGYITTSLRK